jgi:hypothetical protein
MYFSVHFTNQLTDFGASLYICFRKSEFHKRIQIIVAMGIRRRRRRRRYVVP